jgi:hypothetical protein
MEEKIILKKGEVSQELKQKIKEALKGKDGPTQKFIDDNKKLKKVILVDKLKSVLKAVVGNAFGCRKKEFSVIFDDGKSKVRISIDDDADANKFTLNAGEFTLDGPVASSRLLFKIDPTYIECWGAKTFHVIKNTTLSTLEIFIDIINKTIEI